MISYFRLILNPRDELSLRRALQSPKRGIGKTTIEKAISLFSGQTLYEALVHYAEENPTKRNSQSILEFHHIIKTMRESVQKKETTILSALFESFKLHLLFKDA